MIGGLGRLIGVALAMLLPAAVVSAQLTPPPVSPDFAYTQQNAFLLNPAVVDQLSGGSFDAKIADAIDLAFNFNRTAPPGLFVSGITADGAASAILVVRTVGFFTSSATVSVGNGATLIPYRAGWRSSPPTAGSTTLTIPTGVLGVHECDGTSGQVCGYAILQAPDLLKADPGGGRVAINTPIQVAITSPAAYPNATHAQALPPAVLLVHGLWAKTFSLQPIMTYLAGQAWYTQGLLDLVSYSGDIAFDDIATQQQIDMQIRATTMQLSASGIVAARFDTVAHSMGGLVMRAYSGMPGYHSSQNRTLGAIHQIITLDTPETGSELASFLLANKNTRFSLLAQGNSGLVALVGCKANFTVGGCIMQIQGPVDAGAVASLAPNSPNIANLPSPKIPMATWNAFASTANQNDAISIFGTTSSLVWSLDQLILATCPGAPYCPLSGLRVGHPIAPKVGDILHDLLNDGIVTLASQRAGCTSPCSVTTFPNTAHTSVNNAVIAAITNDTNVVTSPVVQAKIACSLLGTCTASAPAAAAVEANVDPQAASTTGTPAPWPYTDIKAFPTKLPALTLGRPFRLEVNFAYDRAKFVSVRQFNDSGDEARQTSVPLERAPDGTTYAVVTPLVIGRVQFVLDAGFTTYLSSSASLTTVVGPPATTPSRFWGDIGAAINLPAGTSESTIFVDVGGLGGNLRPAFVWPSAPDIHVVPHTGTSFTLAAPADAAVLVLTANGSFTCRTVGTATIVVGYAGLTTRKKVQCVAPPVS